MMSNVDKNTIPKNSIKSYLDRVLLTLIASTITCGLCIFAICFLIIFSVGITTLMSVSTIPNKELQKNILSVEEQKETFSCYSYSEFVAYISDQLSLCADQDNSCESILKESEHYITTGIKNLRNEKICYKNKPISYFKRKIRYVVENHLAGIYQEIETFNTLLKSQKNEGLYLDEIKDLSNILRLFQKIIIKEKPVLDEKCFESTTQNVTS